MVRMDQASKLTFKRVRDGIALFCSLLLAVGDPALLAQTNPAANSSETSEVSRIPPEQLDSLVAPIALYPDPLLSQTLVAAIYPLEIIQLQQWLQQNKNLKDKALADAVKKQDWDPSIQAMAALPEVVKRLAEDIKWTNTPKIAQSMERYDRDKSWHPTDDQWPDDALASNERVDVPLRHQVAPADGIV